MRQVEYDSLLPTTQDSGDGGGDGKSATVTIQKCFDAFVKNEQLQESEAWRCPRCKEMKAPNKTFAIWSSPDVLVLHLKR